MDTVAFELIEALRAENKMRTLAAVGRPAKFLQMAQDLGLGIRIKTRVKELGQHLGLDSKNGLFF